MTCVLVVEDEALIRLSIVMMLETAGYEVLEAGHADEAIRLLEQNERVRVVVTDVDMPGSMDGAKLSHYVRNRWPPIQLVVVSGKAQQEALSLAAGVRFLAKPYGDHVMLGVIKEMVDAGAWTP
jgi:CheY-like chemotaxis protein